MALALASFCPPSTKPSIPTAASFGRCKINQILRNKNSALRLAAAHVSSENSFKDQLKEVLAEFFNEKLKMSS